MRLWRFIFIALLAALLSGEADAVNRLTNVTDWTGRKTTIAYDLDSQVTNITRPNGTYRTISYDAAGQVTNIWEQMTNGLPLAWFRLNWANSGNLNWEFAAPLPHVSTAPTRTMTYDADNRLSTFKGPTMSSAQMVTVDADGNLTTGPVTSDTFTNYAYDGRNRLLNASGVTSQYDAVNNRIGQNAGTNVTTYVVNPNAALPQVLMRIKNGVTNYYIYGVGLMYQVTESATGTNTLTYHYDYRGSTVALTGDNGLPTDRIEYSLYGLTTYRAGTNDTPFLFNGQYGVQTDANGLLYMRSRYYNPYLCRFINPDPSGFAGGLNLYAYANGNPVSYLDPFGLGALGESALTDSYFDAPTELQTEIQAGLVDFANIVTLGIANDVSIATSGYDLDGSFATPDETQTADINLATAFIPVVGIEEGTASRLATDVGEDLTEEVPDDAASVSTALSKYYPSDNGFSGATGQTFLMAGQTIDRYGGSSASQFFSPGGTPALARALPPGTASQPLRTFQVIKPFEVQSGTVAPWFNQPGGGVQYMTPVNLEILLQRGILKEITK